MREFALDFLWWLGAWAMLWIGLTAAILIVTNNADNAVQYAQAAISEMLGAR